MSVALQEQTQPISSGGGGGGVTLPIATSDVTGLDTTLAAKVVGPASSTDNAVTRFDGTTGKLVQNSGVIIDDSNNISGVVGITCTGNITLSTPGATVDGVDLTALASTVSTNTSNISSNTSAIASKADVNFTINTQTGTSYTLVLGDAAKLIDMSNASAIALTIPANSSVPFPIGTIITVLQAGAGQVTVGITTDTLNGRNGLKTAGQWAVITLIKRTSTTWVLSGDSTT